jgi:predicted dehydrogenase
VACPFDARRIYLGSNTGWPVSTIAADLSPAGRLAALQTGPYGRCVYHCDNDAVDHQTVTMELASGGTAVLVMHGHSQQETRTMRYDGTRATLRGRFGGDGDVLEIRHHLEDRVERVTLDGAEGGHGGGDGGLLEAFVAAVRGEGQVTTLEEAAVSHRLALAAERSRLAGEVVEIG